MCLSGLFSEGSEFYNTASFQYIWHHCDNPSKSPIVPQIQRTKLMVFMPEAFSTPVTAHVVLFVMILQSLFVPWVLIFSFPDVLVGNIVILLEFIQLKKMRT